MHSCSFQYFVMTFCHAADLHGELWLCWCLEIYTLISGVTCFLWPLSSHSLPLSVLCIKTLNGHQDTCLKRRKVRKKKNFKQNAASFCVVRMNIYWIAFKHLWERKIIYVQTFYHYSIKDWKNNPYAYHWRTVIFPLFKV